MYDFDTGNPDATPADAELLAAIGIEAHVIRGILTGGNGAFTQHRPCGGTPFPHVPGETPVASFDIPFGRLAP